MIKILILFFCLAPCCVFGQKVDTRIQSISSVQKAEEFRKQHPELDSKLFTISSDRDTSDITVRLFEKPINYTFTIDNYEYKIVEKTSSTLFRASYIFLDGDQLSISAIDSIRQTILKKYKEGAWFVDLVKEYTMDGDHNGDLGWIEEGTTMSEFEKEIKLHKNKDIFTVNIASKNWYYVVLKTEDDMPIKRLKIFRLKN